MGKPQQIGRLVLVELMVASLSIRSFIILVFSVFYNRIKYSSWCEMRTCRSVYGEQTGVSIIDSILHCPSGKRICQNKLKPRNVATLLKRAKLEYLSSIVFHTVLVAEE